MGTYTNQLPNNGALTALEEIIDCAESLGKITSNYILMGHRDVVATECPGDALYEEIQGWPHYP